MTASNTILKYAILLGLLSATIGTAVAAPDSTPPSISYTPSATSTGTYNQTWVLVNISANDSGSGLSEVEVYFDGQRQYFQQNSGQYYWSNFTDLGDGTYNFYAIATDSKGNIASTDERIVELNSSYTKSPTITDRGGIVLAFALLTLVFAYLAVNTPKEHGPLQILNYIFCFLTALFTGYLAYSATTSKEGQTGLLIVWNNAFAWVFYTVVAYFVVYILAKAFELYKAD